MFPFPSSARKQGSLFPLYHHAGIEPTNNLTEQAIRFVVIDQRIIQEHGVKKAPVVANYLDGDPHMRSAGSRGLSVPMDRPMPFCLVLLHPHSCRQVPDNLLTVL